MSFVERLIDMQFTLKTGQTFDNSGLNTLKLKNLKVHAKVVKAGNPGMGSMICTVYGMTRSHMNLLNTLGPRIQFTPKNSVVLTAGDANQGMGEVFRGNISNAYTDFNAQPDTGFVVECLTNFGDSVSITNTITRPPGTSVAAIASDIAQKMGLRFENNKVTMVTAGHTYLSGSPMNQLQKLLRNNRCGWVIDKGTLAIFPFLGSRVTTQIPEVSTKTGMIGYPSYNAWGINLKTVYRPDIEFQKRINVKSDLIEASGDQWTVYTMDYELQSRTVRGLWQLALGCYDPKYGLKIAGQSPNA